MVSLEHLDLRALRERKEILAQMDPPDLLVQMASMVNEGLLVQRARKENLEIKEDLGLEDLLVWRDQREILEHLVFQDHLENKDHME